MRGCVIATVCCLNCVLYLAFPVIMAANYWESTQRRHWQYTRETLSDIRQALEDEDRTLVQQYPLPERRLYSIFFNQRKCLFDLYLSAVLI